MWETYFFFLQKKKMALSANSPIYRGYLADVDARWNVISSSVDDRTPEERGLKASAVYIPKNEIDVKILIWSIIYLAAC